MRYLIFITLCLLTSCQDKSSFSLDGTNTIWIAPDEPAYVHLAVQDLISDVAKITGKQMVLVENPSELKEYSLIIGTINDPAVAALLPSERLQTLQGKWEQYTLLHLDRHQQLKQVLLIAGSNPRGTMFGIYHFLEHQLGVDPLYFWTDNEPPKREKIDLSKLDITSTVPDFKFRGWFINDEDLLTEWKDGGGKRTIDYPYYGQIVAPEVIAKVAEAAVRLRYNLIIPASFVDIRNPAEERLVEESSKRGLYVSMHHVEPVGVSAFGYQNYWKEKGKSPLFSFYSEPEKLEQTWRDYIQRWSKYPDVIWQIGLRGIADRPMWMADPGIPQSDADRGKIISDAMQLQKQLIQAITHNPNPLMTTTLWAEGAALHQSGDLTIPDSVMVIFADNSPGWVWQQDFYDIERKAGWKYGVYFHHQLWGSGPHLAQGVPPSKTHEMFRKAKSTGADEYAIMNVSNIREFPLALESSTEMLWAIDNFDAKLYLEDWCARRFPLVAKKAAAAYQQFFDSYQLVGERQVPGYLDGQQRMRALAILKDLEQQLDDPDAYRKKQATPSIWNNRSDAFYRSLSDMNPASSFPLDTILPQVKQQLADLAQAAQLAETALSDLEGTSKAFLETNLLAQIHILSGIGQWLLHCIQAKQAADKNDWAAAKQSLEQSLLAFTTIQKGQQLASQGKWQDWYRGDKKMNLPSAEAQTKAVLLKLERVF